MSYAEALERVKKVSGSPDQAVPKVPEPPFGTFGTPSPGESENFNRFAVVALVQCRDCQHFEPDAINPPAGLGRCLIDAAGDRLAWPRLRRRCESFEVTRAAVLRRCEAACVDLQTNCAELCGWLISQGDPGWLMPAAVRRWAQIVKERGYPLPSPNQSKPYRT